MITFAQKKSPQTRDRCGSTAATTDAPAIDATHARVCFRGPNRALICCDPHWSTSSTLIPLAQVRGRAYARVGSRGILGTDNPTYHTRGRAYARVGSRGILGTDNPTYHAPTALAVSNSWPLRHAREHNSFTSDQQGPRARRHTQLHRRCETPGVAARVSIHDDDVR